MTRFDRLVKARVAWILAELREGITARARANVADEIRERPTSRVCYLCKRRHRFPKRLTVVHTDGRRERRWVSRRCWEAKTGFTAAASDGYQQWQISVP